MVLYTVMPGEVIFGKGVLEGGYKNEYESDKERKEVLANYMGTMMYVEKEYDGSFSVKRLISTDPRDFINPVVRPGMKLKSSLIQFTEPLL